MSSSSSSSSSGSVGSVGVATVNIERIPPLVLVKALWDRAEVCDFAKQHNLPPHEWDEQSEKLAREAIERKYVPYISLRPIMVHFNTVEVDPSAYDNLNPSGPGTLAAIVQELRATYP